MTSESISYDDSLTADVVAAKPSREWDALIRSSAESTIFHTSAWADRLSELWRCEPIQLVVHDRAGAPVVAALAFDVFSDAMPLDGPTLRQRARALRDLIRPRPRRLQWFGQPVVLKSELARPGLVLLLATIERVAAQSGVRAIGPCEFPADAVAVVPVGWTVRWWATLLIDLRVGEDELWRRAKPAVRKSVRRATEQGVEVNRIGSLEELETYYEFVRTTARRYHKAMYGFKDFETMWRHFRTDAVFETFVARQRGETVAGLSIWGDNGNVAELGSFQSVRAFDEKIAGPDLVKWEAIRWAAANECRTFDLAGVDPSPTDQKTRGIRQFKEKWGGHEVPYLVLTHEPAR